MQSKHDHVSNVTCSPPHAQHQIHRSVARKTAILSTRHNPQEPKYSTKHKAYLPSAEPQWKAGPVAVCLPIKLRSVLPPSHHHLCRRLTHQAPVLCSRGNLHAPCLPLAPPAPRQLQLHFARAISGTRKAGKYRIRTAAAF